MHRLGVGSVHTSYGKDDWQRREFSYFLGCFAAFCGGDSAGSSGALSPRRCERGGSASCAVRFVSATVEKIRNVSKVAAKQFTTGEMCFEN